MVIGHDRLISQNNSDKHSASYLIRMSAHCLVPGEESTNPRRSESIGQTNWTAASHVKSRFPRCGEKLTGRRCGNLRLSKSEKIQIGQQNIFFQQGQTPRLSTKGKVTAHVPLTQKRGSRETQHSQIYKLFLLLLLLFFFFSNLRAEVPVPLRTSNEHELTFAQFLSLLFCSGVKSPAPIFSVAAQLFLELFHFVLPETATFVLPP